MNRFLPQVTFTALVLLGLFSPASADPAFMIPRSNKVLKGGLTFPDGSRVQFVIRDGTWVTVEDQKEHYFLGFSGVVKDWNLANFLAYKLVRTTAKDTVVTELPSSPLSPGSGRNVHVGRYVKLPETRGIAVSLKEISEWNFATPPIPDPSGMSPLLLEMKYGVSMEGVCCVTCGDRTVCAMSVASSCGDCSGGGMMY